MESPPSVATKHEQRRSIVRAMYVYAIASSGFGLTYLFGRPRVWGSFVLQQLEAALFVTAAVFAPRVDARRRTILLSLTFIVATGLIVPAAHLAGESQILFLTVLPLLVAVTLPDHPLPVLASAVSCFLGAFVLLVVFHESPEASTRLSSTFLVVLSVGFGAYRLADVRNQLDELKALQEQLMMKERLTALGEAAAVVAHEVRNPLGTIANAVALLRKDSGSGREELLATVDEEVSRLDRLVHDLLVLAKPLTANKKRVNVVDLVARSARAASGHGDPRVEIRANKAAPVEAPADAELLQLALVNLLRNALQVSPVEGSVAVEVASSGGDCIIAVEDHGPGIPPEVRSRMFEPFFTTRSSGTGLGLTLAKRVVEAHEGTLTVAAETGRTGTRFEIRLPGGA